MSFSSSAVYRCGYRPGPTARLIAVGLAAAEGVYARTRRWTGARRGRVGPGPDRRGARRDLLVAQPPRDSGRALPASSRTPPDPAATVWREPRPQSPQRPS